MFQKRHFICIANVLQAVRPNDAGNNSPEYKQWVAITGALGQLFQDTSQQFDPKRFLDACLKPK